MTGCGGVATNRPSRSVRNVRPQVQQVKAYLQSSLMGILLLPSYGKFMNDLAASRISFTSPFARSLSIRISRVSSSSPLRHLSNRLRTLSLPTLRTILQALSAPKRLAHTPSCYPSFLSSVVVQHSSTLSPAVFADADHSILQHRQQRNVITSSVPGSINMATG